MCKYLQTASWEINKTTTTYIPTAHDYVKCFSPKRSSLLYPVAGGTFNEFGIMTNCLDSHCCSRTTNWNIALFDNWPRLHNIASIWYCVIFLPRYTTAYCLWDVAKIGFLNCRHGYWCKMALKCHEACMLAYLGM